jgi:hypothetical protein
MKKQSASRSAFFNSRVLIGFVLCSIGLFLAVVGLSKFVTGMSAATATAQTNPVPLINQPLVPAATAPGGPGFTLTVNGTGFVSGAQVNWNGSARATTFISSSQLTVSILASDIAVASTASVTVVNPSPGGGTSNVVFFPITIPASSVSFTTSENASGNTPVFVAVGDFNGDRRLDLAVANFGSNTVSVFLGNGDGTFQPHVDYATGGTPSSVTVGDFNRDGKLDLVLTNGTFSVGNSVSVLLGNGNGTFQGHVEYRTGLGPTKSVTGDFNLDGNLDIAVANYGPAFTTGSVSILLGNGDGTFQARIDYPAGVNPIGVMVGDFDSDGAMDLAVGDNNFPQGVSVLLGNGDGTFQSATHYQTQHGPRSGIVADMNFDGKLDLAFAPYDGTGAVGVYIFIGNGDGTFQPEVSYRAGAGANSVNGADFNGDGLLDLAVANVESNNVSVLLGQGDGTFQPHVDYSAGSGPAQLAIGDFNGDGMLDLAVANQTSNTVSVFLQNPVTSQGCVLPPPGLVSWWSGDRTADDVQGTNNGTLRNGTSFRKGIVGPGFAFDGVNDSVKIPNSASLSQTRLTVASWIFPTGNQNLSRRIVGKDEGFGSEIREYATGILTINTPAAFVSLPSGIKEVDGVTTIQLNTWYHIAMTHDGLKLRLYVNGVLDGVVDAVGDSVPTSAPGVIGGDEFGDFPEFFKGIIDEAQIFNRALSDAEIMAIYQAGSAGQCKPEIFVSSIDPSYSVVHSQFLVTTSVAIQDTNGIAPAGATVNVKTLFPNGTELGFSAVTDESGNANISFHTAETGLYKFKVRNVSLSGRTYDASLNIETSDTLVIP